VGGGDVHADLAGALGVGGDQAEDDLDPGVLEVGHATRGRGLGVQDEHDRSGRVDGWQFFGHDDAPDSKDLR
jgi:hypothetical protein